jgi:hypothetical protein
MFGPSVKRMVRFVTLLLAASANLSVVVPAPLVMVVIRGSFDAEVGGMVGT